MLARTAVPILAGLVWLGGCTVAGHGPAPDAGDPDDASPASERDAEMQIDVGTPSDDAGPPPVDAGGPGCGDGVCASVEDDSVCGADCGCRATPTVDGVAPAGCRCDRGCDGRGDCCADACQAYGTCSGPVSHANMNIYTHWSMDSADLDELTSPLRVESDPSGQSFFWATTFWLGTQGGYIGAQTVGAENQGKQVRFSIWESVRAEAAAGEGGACRDFDGEGVGKTCWIPLSWEAGDDMTLRVRRLPSGVWRGSVVLESGVERVIGDIEGPPGGGLIHSNVSAFTEYYGAYLPSCESLNRAEVVFEGPMGAGGAVGSQRTGSSVGSSACEPLFSEAPAGVRGGRHRIAAP